ncbi:MAG: hypothetical protein IH873_05555 [Chloroflexi bacterium]|nr:hypothetical protein [Chloroflexota bacterium]
MSKRSWIILGGGVPILALIALLAWASIRSGGNPGGLAVNSNLVEAEINAEAEYVKECRYREQYRRQWTEELARYHAMLEQVNAWEPPTADHVELKNSMVEHLTIHVQRDAFILEEPVRRSGEQWLAVNRESAARSVAFDRKAISERRKTAASENAWVVALYDSLLEA